MANVTLRVKKNISGNTKLILVLRSYEAKRLVCARNWTLFITSLPVIQSLRQQGNLICFLLHKLVLSGSLRQFVSMKWFQKLINSFVYVIKQWCHICRKWGTSDHAVETLLICCAINFFNTIYVTLEHKTSLKSLVYFCSINQKCIVWVKIIDFCFMPKIIRT